MDKPLTLIKWENEIKNARRLYDQLQISFQIVEAEYERRFGFKPTEYADVWCSMVYYSQGNLDMDAIIEEAENLKLEL